jgi:osmoprotectant transport system permease protein
MKPFKSLLMALSAIAILLHASLIVNAAESAPIVVGSKKFTESVILGDVLAGLVRASNKPVRHRRELGGSRVLWKALLMGDVDSYVEYTGTLMREILSKQHIKHWQGLKKALARQNIAITKPLGFNNTYAMGLRRDIAEQNNITMISGLRAHPELALGFSNEFMNRGDGWPGLKAHYGLSHKHVRGLDHDLAYRGVKMGDLAGTDVYTTDADIAYYDLVLLRDDQKFFPAYEAVILYRADLKKRAPQVVAKFHRLEGLIDAARMRSMNAAVKLKKRTESTVAAEFLHAQFKSSDQMQAGIQKDSLWTRMANTTIDHLFLVVISLGAAIVVAVPLGIMAARRPRPGQIILSIAGIIQTIPTLALFVFMIPLLGIGGPPAIVALFLYSLLPIIRNTHAGLIGISPSMTESAAVLGLPSGARLRLIELPLAGRSILAGIKTSAVINVGTATLGALIGAGGYGQPILTGIRLDDIGLILEGAIPAALLALIVQGVFEGAERLLVPKGLRLKPIQ